MAEDDAEHFLDLAGFADGLLDPDDRERIAERLARDPADAADVSATCALAAADPPADAVTDAIFARAAALAGPDPAATDECPTVRAATPHRRQTARGGEMGQPRRRGRACQLARFHDGHGPFRVALVGRR